MLSSALFEHVVVRDNMLARVARVRASGARGRIGFATSRLASFSPRALSITSSMLIPNHPRAQRIHGVPLGVVFAGSVSGAACMTHEPADFDDHVARMNMDFDSDDLLAQSFEEQAEEQVHF